MAYVSRDLTRCVMATTKECGIYTGWMVPGSYGIAVTLRCVLDGHLIMGLHYTKELYINPEPGKILMATPYAYLGDSGMYRVRVEDRVLNIARFFNEIPGKCGPDAQQNLTGAAIVEAEHLMNVVKAAQVLKRDEMPVCSNVDLMTFGALNGLEGKVQLNASTHARLLKKDYMTWCRDIGYIK